MIAGIGIDIIEVDRIKENIMKDNGFRELVFSASEIGYCESRKNKYEHYAARFAAKEAFFKALGTGWPNDTSFNEVEIINDHLGKPQIAFIGQTQTTMHGLQLVNILVSLTHIKSTASAVVIIEK